MQPVQIKPSAPGAQFSSADLLRATVTPQQAARIILEQTAQGGLPDAVALLAAMFKEQRKQNAKFQPVPFDLPIWTLQQVLPENPQRSYLLIQNVGGADLMVVHETGPLQPQDFSAATAQAYLTIMQTRAIRIISGGNYEPLVAPSNPISIFTLAAVTNGVVIEGA